MTKFKCLFLLLLAITFQSCSKDDELPTSDENSFTVKLNGERFVAEDVDRFLMDNYVFSDNGIDKNRFLTFRNSSDIVLVINLRKLEGIGNYEVGIDESFLSDRESAKSSVAVGTREMGVEYHTYSPELNEKIEITEIGDNFIVGEFDRITLSDPDNPDDTVILTEGRFDINRPTLNSEEDF